MLCIRRHRLGSRNWDGRIRTSQLYTDETQMRRAAKVWLKNWNNTFHIRFVRVVGLSGNPVGFAAVLRPRNHGT